ncbi:auxin-responsive protein SAUR32-like [Olea europaea var. sylvestris]|uniref:auxin-responsive protein SAUR32-like n=1 Tax=Olea europaea var. sylvestris TaxID=158386 RepID=UPI000C1D56AC|nr:auxin-responsive protein SAUR32-like [Olea europaea var. sylvestris]
MGSGEKSSHHLNFHLHMPHIHFHHHGHGHGGGKKELRNVPKGCLAITVGQGAEQQRFIIPVIYINHPLFMQLLKAAEEEYGFDQKGPINIPCHVEEFRHVHAKIDEENSHQQHQNHHYHHHRHHQFLCFGA